MGVPEEEVVVSLERRVVRDTGTGRGVRGVSVSVAVRFCERKIARQASVVVISW